MAEIEALALSALIEMSMAGLVARAAGWTGRGLGHVVAAAALATAVTHPQFWTAALFLYPRAPYWLTLLGLETLVVLIEGLLIAWVAGLRVSQAMMISLLANSASLLAGLWLAW